MRVVRSAGLAVIALIVVACSPSPKAAGNAGPAGLAGATATSYEVPRTDGRTDALARHRGHVVLLNLWATWCPPCREEMPALERVWRAERARGLDVLGVDQGESAATAAAFARERGVTFPILLDAAQRYGATYAAVGLPTTIVIDRNGRVVRGIDGPMTFEAMRSAVEPLLRT